MIHDVAERLNSVLTPEDLALLGKAFARVCELRGISPASPRAQESAKVLIKLYQSGIRNRFELVADDGTEVSVVNLRTHCTPVNPFAVNDIKK